MTTYLLVRELAILAIATAFGAGFMALVHRDDLAGWRVALAPSAGLAVGSGILLSVNLLVPLRHAFWFVVLPAAIISALLIRRSGLRRPPGRELVGVATVLAVALGSGSYAMVQRDTPGPVGYGIFDATGYVTFTQGYERHTSADPLLDVNLEGNAAGSGVKPIDWGQPWNLAERYGWAYRWQHTGALTVAASASGVGGWAAWTMVGAMVAVLIAIGSLGSYGMAGYFGAGPIARTLAGVMYAGPLVLVAGINGSIGLLAGLATLPALLVAVIAGLEHPTKRTALIAGALVGGLQSIYPEMLPALIGGIVIAVLLRFCVPVVRRRARPNSLMPALRVLPLAIGAGLLVGLRAVPWTWQYLVDDHYSEFRASLVPYNMVAKYVPGWLYQTREFYSFAFLSPSGKLQTLVGVILPLALILISAAALAYSQRARWLGGILLAIIVQAWWAKTSFGCAYCAERSLLIAAPLLPALLATGVSLLMARGGGVRDAVLVLTSLAAVAMASTAIATQQRVREGMVVVPTTLEPAVRDAGRLHRTTLLEGFGSMPYSSWLLGPTSYEALTDRVPRVSIVPTYDEWGGMAYFGVRHDLDNPAWTPAYETVVTRFGSVRFPGRTLVASHPPYFIQRRARPFDVTIASGVASDQPDRDPGGVAWVQPVLQQLGKTQQPLSFWVAAQSSQPAFLRLRLEGPPGLSVKRIDGLGNIRSREPKPGTLDICAPVRGTAATRRAVVRVAPEPPIVGPPLRRFENAPVPAKTINVASVSATDKPCK
jgi:hypothetical protein